jgi:non-specific serine/threonine protein kinase
MWRTLGAPMFFGPGYLVLRDLVIGEVRAELGEARWHTAHDEGGRLSLAEAAAYALEERRGPRRPAADPWHPLTKREQEVARLIAEGLSNREIAERLVIAKRTVDSHVEHILAKLAATSRLQIAGWVAER